MKIWTHAYTLEPKKNLNAQADSSPRPGCLVKMEWEDGLIGYSDLFPWPEFGDPSFDRLHQILKTDTAPTHPLITRSMHFNRLDATARAEGRSLFKDLDIPESHGLIVSGAETYSKEDILRQRDVLKAMGFRVFKLKMTGVMNHDLLLTVDLLKALDADEKIRLDFNGIYSPFDSFTYLKALSAHTDRLPFIDLIEDPWNPTLNPDESLSLPKELQRKMAGDFYQHPLWVHRVIKPAREIVPEKLQRRDSAVRGRIILTHSMDHPVGQAFALYEAAHLTANSTTPEIHGVARPQIYKSTDFDWAWNGAGSRPEPPAGSGIGFDDLLPRLNWSAS